MTSHSSVAAIRPDCPAALTIACFIETNRKINPGSLPMAQYRYRKVIPAFRPRCSQFPHSPERKAMPALRACLCGVWPGRPAIESRRGKREGDQDPHLGSKAIPAGPCSRICTLPLTCILHLHHALPGQLMSKKRMLCGQANLPSRTDVYIYFQHLIQLIKLRSEAFKCSIRSSYPAIFQVYYFLTH